MTNNEFLNTLEQIRLDRNLSVTEFAELLGISYDTYYRWKRGEQPKTMVTCLTILNFCREEKII